jgi:hypothetical protein
MSVRDITAVLVAFFSSEAPHRRSVARRMGQDRVE